MSCASISRRRRYTSWRSAGSACRRRESGSCHPTAGTRSAPSPTASPCTGSTARARRSMRSALPRTRSWSRSAASRMKFCANCGAAVVQRVPPGDTLARWVCEHCGEIHYQNPKLVIGTVPEHEGKVLLCRRAIEPRYGYWTLPAGFMENDETTAQAALRETLEEAGAPVELQEPLTLISLPRVEQGHLFFCARLRSGDHKPREGTLEVALFEEAAIPWDQIAFRTVATTLRHWFADRRRGAFAFHAEDLP